MIDIGKYKFIGMLLPNGIRPSIKNPNEVIFSVCIFINKYCTDFITENKSPQDIQTQYQAFYREFRRLKDYLHKINNINLVVSEDKKSDIFIKGYGSENPFQYFCNERDFIEDNETEIRKNLWDQIFPEKDSKSGLNIQFNPDSKVLNHNIGPIADLLSNKDIQHLINFSTNPEVHKSKIKLTFKDNLPEQDISDLMKKMNEFANVSENVALKDKLKFIQNYRFNNKGDYGEKIERIISLFAANRENSISIDVKREQMSFFLNMQQSAIDNYIKSLIIDIDEVINNFNAISNEPVLMRLMGFIKDYKIDLPNDYDSTNFKIQFLEADPNILILPTEITTLKIKNKVAYLVCHNEHSEKYFENSILKSDSKLNRFDKVTKVSQLIDFTSKMANGENPNGNENKDALTRGILYTNKYLTKIIEPVPIVNNDNQVIIEYYTDDFVTRGHRVAVKINAKNIYSLTSRSIALRLKKNKNPFYFCGNVESCIHFDTPMAYMQNGNVQSVSSDVLFEYSGELLKLKSAFSKAMKINKASKWSEQVEYHNDDGLYKSIARFEAKCEINGTKFDKIISFFHYPYNEIQIEGYLNCYYNLPNVFDKQYGPKLRFGNDYAFVVYQEYLNGWGLPLNKQSNSQLSLEEILSEKTGSLYLSESIKFQPLENKKTVLLFYREEVYDENSKPIEERESLEHLVVRSYGREDSNQLIAERLVLPPKIELEPAFWYNLISEPNMNAEESFNVKRRSNCQFIDEHSYNEYVNSFELGKRKKCPEGCVEYCGGTQMESSYTDKIIKPNFLTDPTVIGFSIKFYWDEDCNEGSNIKVSPNDELIWMKFGGKAGIAPSSYLLRVLGSDNEIYIDNFVSEQLLDIYIKKGMTIYATLKNKITKEGNDALENGWWKDLPYPYKDSLDIDERNLPKKITLTHAVKEPLFTPKIFALFSTPKDRKSVEHIEDWCDYEFNKRHALHKNYKLDKNIVAERIDQTNKKESINSSFSRIQLQAHFERLDAFKKIEFLKNIIPTGGLELWMRKEEYIDDPNQIVLFPNDENEETNHLPNEPLLTFTNPRNLFSLEFKIDFSNDIMSQLKDVKNIKDISEIDNVFCSLISKLQFEYDFKTTKFEEREYYLKNVSKFKGFFTEKKLSENDMEQYVLPKLEEVMYYKEDSDNDTDDNSWLRFSVMMLNNQPPPKPDIAYATTTIQEKRSYPEDDKTVSIQKGNIVTIYLKRNRLISGKDERVGIIVDSNSLYNEIYKENDLISKAGRDIVSDMYSTRSQYLQFGDIIIPKNNHYHVGFDNKLGIYHFLPTFDIEKQLWKIEVELDVKTRDGKQLHNPFINFSIIHYQPFSINHNDIVSASLVNLKNDCRISDIESSVWCYLLPERKLSVFFDKPNWLFDPWGNIDLTVSFDFESLHHFNYPESKESKWKVRTNFILTVQGSDDGILWYSLNSQIDDGNHKSFWSFHHALLTREILEQQNNQASLKLKFQKESNPQDEDNSIRYSEFRIRFIEVEWFSNETWEEILAKNSNLLKNDIVDNEDMRIRYVELIY